EGDAPQAVHEKNYYASFETLDRLYNQKISWVNMGKAYESLPEKEKTAQKLAQILSEGLGREIDADFVASHKSDIKQIKKAIEQKESIVWATGSHTSTPLIVMVTGKKPSGYNGVYHDTELPLKIMSTLSLK
ncbi:MAG: hypothetical protein LBR90_05140, partial [Elusimicrobiota bacterium]|nr:hypothetical protein [Elusimicrobiota bacterium]